MAREQWIEAGRIVNTHGVNGEVKIEVWLDSPQFLKRCGCVYLDGTPRRLVTARAHKQFLLAQLEGVDSLNDAMALKGKTLTINRDDAPLGRDEYFVQDILGAQVLDEQGKVLGVLTEVLERPANTVYVVQGEREILIPAVPAFVLHTDARAGTVTVRLIEGM